MLIWQKLPKPGLRNWQKVKDLGIQKPTAMARTLPTTSPPTLNRPLTPSKTQLTLLMPGMPKSTPQGMTSKTQATIPTQELVISHKLSGKALKNLDVVPVDRISSAAMSLLAISSANSLTTSCLSELSQILKSSSQSSPSPHTACRKISMQENFKTQMALGVKARTFALMTKT